MFRHIGEANVTLGRIYNNNITTLAMPNATMISAQANSARQSNVR
jgi:hypothetical protein